MSTWVTLMRGKLGLFSQQSQDNDLLSELLALMAAEHSDYTRTFRLLSETEQHQSQSPLRDEFINRPAFDHWFTKYRQRLADEQVSDQQRQEAMLQANPAIILRNYLAQQVIEETERGESSALAALHQALQNPFRLEEQQRELFNRPPEWGKTLEVSCSS